VLCTADVDLNGVQLGRDPAAAPGLTIPEGECLPCPTGVSLLFAQDLDPAVNGGLPTPDFEFNFAVVDSNGRLFVGAGGAVLDEITWTSVTSGASTSLDPAHANPTDNDVPANWCDGTASYGTNGDKGTPKADNPACP